MLLFKEEDIAGYELALRLPLKETFIWQCHDGGVKVKVSPLLWKLNKFIVPREKG